MRKQLVQTVTSVMEWDERLVLLLGDIGVYGFREAFQKFPKRCYNLGTCEQSMVSLAAGLALDGMIPVVHTIAPFLVERAFEQIKLDFGYQWLNGNFISVGGSYQYSSLGCSHHCPGDVAILKTISNMDIFVPGHPDEFDHQFRMNYFTDKPKYWRLSEQTNSKSHSIVIKEGKHRGVVAIGPMADRVIEACEDLDVTIDYTSRVAPFSYAGIQHGVVVTPFYENSLSEFKGLEIGVPRRFLTHYGTVAEHDDACGLTPEKIRKRIVEYFNL
jgi:transketolase